MDKNTKIYVAGHKGMVGSALMRQLIANGYNNIVVRSRSELDLNRQANVEAFFKDEKPEYVFLLAARTGGIVDNGNHPADALITNSLIELNVIKTAFEAGAKKLIFSASSTVYPETATQPLRENSLLTGPLEPRGEGYALSKILGIKLCEKLGKQYGAMFSAVVLPNLYGQNCRGHTVVPMLFAKFYNAVKEEADSVGVWGSGNVRREFMHADDVADAMLFLMDKHKTSEHINVGFGSDVKISELAELIGSISGFKGKIMYDKSMPDGTPRKLLDSSKLFDMGWKPKISLQDGLRQTYADYLINRDAYRS